MQTILFELASRLFSDAKLEYTQSEKISERLLIDLHTLFGDSLRRAIELLEKEAVTVISNVSDIRHIVKIIDADTEYTLFNDVNFCTCSFYKKRVLTGRNLACKHVLAAKLAAITKYRKFVFVSDEKLEQELGELQADVFGGS